nr:conserved phage C-terminal domain-containing protein [Streptococcus agalactiae]
MAQKRMFNLKITDSDKFLDLPLSSQALYFHLNMHADDDGFVDSTKKIKRMIGASDGDLRILMEQGFILPFETGVIVIKDWKIHNYIPKDRYQKTIYTTEFSRLSVAENNSYTECIQNVDNMYTQNRLDKNRLDKNRLDKNRLDKQREDEEKELDKEKEYNVEQSTTEYTFPSWLESEYVEQVKKGNPKNFDYRIPIAYLNQKTNSNYKFVDSNTNLVKSRLKDKYTLDDFKIVIDKKTAEWGKDAGWSKYLRPSTLFNASKFESYLNQPEVNKENYYQRQQGQRFSQAELDELKKPDPKYGF